MKQVYHFESNNPPALSESKLRAELERRKLRRQTTLLAVAAILSIWCAIAAAMVLRDVSSALSLLCLAYACVSIWGGAVIVIVFADKRRNYTWR